MKKLITFITFSILSIMSYGQEITVDEILSIKEEKVPTYKPEIISGRQLYLKMVYGSSFILNASEIKKIVGAKVARVDIVYSDYPQGDQYPVLTRKRIENLKKINSTLFTNKDIEWRLVRQTNCTDPYSAKKLFHGLVITYRPVQSNSEIEKEIRYIKDVLSNLKKVSSDEHGLSEIIDNEIEFLSDTTASGSHFSSKYSPAKYVYPKFTDSTVISILKRNNWINMAITADLTGSMSPYTAQLLVWLRLNTTNDKVKQFVFFNDGDMTLNHQKIIGKTGGIYDTRSAKFEEVEKLAFTTMRNGSGGDFPENNIEALLKAIELCSDCNNIILIADNWAKIKDISLMSQIKKPIKIILCGVDAGINTDYLDLARATGGSVHIMESDLTELMKLNEGQQITIRGQTFKIINGKFVRISKI
ncbi:MAG: hypothetical protein PHQ74_06125 [Crocinitomicaceae bacterium]|nr:hypothetical protein [Crocinitomicaceae bacterium]